MVAVATISIQPWALICDACAEVIATATIARGHKPTARAKCGACGGRARWHPHGHAAALTKLEPVDPTRERAYASVRRL